MTSSAKENTNPEQLVDQYSRTISYLRLSITDRCNLRCLYCMPQRGVDSSSLVKCTDLLSYEELLRIVGVAVGMGMNKLRLTGGEPLVRNGVMDFIRSLAGIKGLEDIRLTTNGVLLHEKAAELQRAGIRNLNISLDTLKPERFIEITGSDLFAQVWQGIQTACDLGFNVKLNVVAMKGINDDEFADFARLATQTPAQDGLVSLAPGMDKERRAIQVRFIEFMPIGNKESWDKRRFIAASELKEIIATLGTLEPDGQGWPGKRAESETPSVAGAIGGAGATFPGSRMEGPARVYRLTLPDGQTGRVGFISPISHHFCDECNRLRLTSEGRLRACLLHDNETDLKAIVRHGGTDRDIQTAIQQTILAKPKGHTLQDDLAKPGQVNCQGHMSRIGG
ncbi:MAG: GTP 3',8-cyclase MoaA [Desulfobulbaceae bacterium]